MKKIVIFSLVSIFLIFCNTSCTTYRSIENADSISQLAGNKFMKNLSRSIIRNINSLSTIKKGQTIPKIRLNAALNSVVPADLMGGFINILSKRYNVPLKKLQENSGSWNTVRDVISFVAKNGSGFKFYIQ
jgi:hypothetical protein